MAANEKSAPAQGAPHTSLPPSVPGNPSSGPYSRSADWYFKKAWAPLPVKDKSYPAKGATGYDGVDAGWDEIQEWIKTRGQLNVAVRANGWVAIDVDEGGAEALAAAQAELGPLPATWTSTSWGPDSPRRHHFYKIPVGLNVARAEKRFTDRFGSSVDILHRFHRYAVVAPSIHPGNGQEYRWYTPEGVWGERTLPMRTELPMLPEAWQAFLKAPEKAQPAAADDFWDAVEDQGWSKGRAQAQVDKMLERIRTVDANVNTQAGGAMREVGRFVPGLLTQDEAEGACRDALLANPHHDDAWNVANNKGWSASTLAGMSVAKGTEESYEVSTDAPEEAEDDLRKYTDAVMAERLVRELLKGRYLFTRGLGWLRFDGKRYAETPDEVIHEDVRKWTIRGYIAAVEAWKVAARAGVTDKPVHEDPDVTGWGKTQNLGRIGSMTTLARGMLLTDEALFDAQAHLLNTPNGVVDLRTGQVTAHGPDQLHTKITNAAYVPGAESRHLKAALGALPDDVPDWLQVRLGEAVTGNSGDQMVLLTGGGRNGKTVLMGAAWRALGGYAASVPNTLLLKGRQLGGATPEKMTLRGVRLAYMEETPEEGYLDSQVVKELMDAEVVQGRQLYKSTVSWTPTHSIFLNTNHPPTVTDTGEGSWRRLVRVDFPYRFRPTGQPLERPTDRVGDPGIKEGLGRSREGQEALLAWMVAGAMRYYAAGSMEEAGTLPPSVVESVRRWRADSDDILRFMDECMTFDQDSWVSGADLYEAFAEWQKANGQRVLSSKAFGPRVDGHTGLPSYVGKVFWQKAREGLSRPGWLHDGVARPLPARVKGYSGLAFSTHLEPPDLY